MIFRTSKRKFEGAEAIEQHVLLLRSLYLSSIPRPRFHNIQGIMKNHKGCQKILQIQLTFNFLVCV